MSTATSVSGPSLAALQTETEQLKKKIAERRETLARIENKTPDGFSRVPIGCADEAKLLRENIAADEGRLADLTAAQDSLREGEHRRLEAEERRRRWKESQGVCRKLKAEYEAAEVNVLQLRADREFAEKKMMEAINLVNHCIAHPPDLDNYPTDEDFEIHAELCEKYKREREAAGAKFREADNAHQKAVLEFVKLRDRFTAAAFSEKNLRPPDATR
jgi:hypothetical protein